MKKSIKLAYRILFLYSFLLALTSCDLLHLGDLNPNPTPAPNGKAQFVSATLVAPATKAQLLQAAQANGFGNYAPLIQYDVNYYRFIYNTTFQGRQIQASGLLGIPQNMPTVPALLSAQHGTMFRQADAPSNFPNTFSGFELFASAGFVTVIPDFIGYGISKNIFHPYYDQPSSGLTVVDMLKAAQYYLGTQHVAVNKNLFLVGYSEGGYVTMAAQKEIETHPEHQLALTAAAAGAGGYDLLTMLNAVAAVPEYKAPSFLAFILQSYNTTYSWNRPLTDFFQQPYASTIPTLLNGTKTRDEIDASLTTSPAALFTPTFYANLKNPAGELVLKQKLAANSFLEGWVPKSPTRLYHGTADEFVFFQTSVTTYERFKAAGATNVEFFPIPGGTHETSVQPMMLNALPWIQSLNK